MENIDGTSQVSPSSAGTKGQGVNLDVLDQYVSPEQKEPDGQQASDDTLQIDPRFKDLPADEGRYRTLQSRYDSTDALYKKTVAELEEEKRYSSLVKSIVEGDENLLYAFVNEVKPGLIPKKDISQVVKAKLKADFGDENFKPELTRDEAERTDPGGKDWQYYRMLDDISAEMKQSGQSKVTSLKEYKEKQKLQIEKENAEAQREIEEAKTKFKMEPAEIQAVANFGEKLRFADLVKIYRFLMRFPNQPGISPSNLQAVPGTSPSYKSDRDKFRESL